MVKLQFLILLMIVNFIQLLVQLTQILGSLPLLLLIELFPSSRYLLLQHDLLTLNTFDL